ncbi:hypothetical protein [Streptomyces sp. XD-27]|uniref:hypothetical protein n=1 Tax=Streptomyces sp. XD-27 TaxID=3062779 RepID=UPI0026F4518B|nr:hypothetical protein [Streptomyces sp. XD-27]WKX73503.1 hypothetical protein Q3Y56_29655 [Streptomyces sp. XD-27]
MLNEDDDLVVVLGMAAAEVLGRDVVDGLTRGGKFRIQPGELAGYGIDAEDFARFQRLWYRFKVPYARASLVWWYVFCLAMGREAEGVAGALDRMGQWLGMLGGTPAAVLPRIGEALGLATDTVVVTDAELTDVAALAAAVRLHAPLVAVDDVKAARDVARAHGLGVVAAADAAVHGPDGAGAAARPPGGAGAAAQPPGGSGAALWLGPPVALRDLPAVARRAWERLADAERDELLAGFEQRVSSIERVRLLVDEEVLDNRAVVAMVAECRKADVADWSGCHLVLATVLWCWHESGCVLQELNQSLLSFPALALFLTRKARTYGGQLATAPGTPASAAPVEPDVADVVEPVGNDVVEPVGNDVVALARRLRAVRTGVEAEFERCLHFDGSNWERREFLLPRSIYRRVQRVPEGLCRHLYDSVGVELPGRTGRPEDWDRLVELALEAGSSPTRLLQEIAHWAANSPDPEVDLAIFTVPVGRKLDAPWTMEFTDLFCYTGFRDGFRPEDHGITASRVEMYNIIAQRMRYNAVKKAQNYAPVQRFAPQGFNLPDIAIAEDANHGGHTAAGIRLACRLPITVEHRGTEWNGLADVRLNRSAYRQENRFRPRDMVRGCRYTQWAKGIADATYRRDLQFAEKWAGKVRDLHL